MDSSHSHCICIFIITVYLKAFPPVLLKPLPVFSLYRIVICQIIIAFLFNPRSPLILIASKKHIAVGGSHHYSHLLCQLAIAGIFIKVIYMHCRPYVICLKTKQKLKYFFVKAGSYGFILCMLPCPRFQLLLVIYKYASILYRRIICPVKSHRHMKLSFFYRYISKIIPGRYAHPS